MTLLKPTFVNVIPSTKTSRLETNLFDYKIPKEIENKLKIGQEVDVPFGNRSLSAIVLKKHNQANNNIRYKQINSIISETPVLERYQISLIDWMKEYYHCSYGEIAKLFLPKRLKKEPTITSSNKYKTYKIHELTTEQNKSYKEIKNSFDKSSTFLLHGVTGSGKTEVYYHLIQDIISNNKQVLLLIPEILLSSQLVSKTKQYFDSNIISFFHSKLSGGDKYKEWLKVKKGISKIIIGPRSAIFSPFTNLGLIIIDEEHDQSYKQYDQNPKYNAKQVAFKLSELLEIPLVLGSATPSIESYHLSTKKLFSKLELKQRFRQKSKLPQIDIVDMREELKSRNYSMLSDNLRDSLHQIIKDNKQAIVFVNRRGASTFILCRECGKTVNCPNCNIPLTYHLYTHSNKTASLLCHHCNYESAPPQKCLDCKSSKIKYFGIGTEKVELELRKEYKNAEIIRADMDTLRTKKAFNELIEKFNSGKINIIIGTQVITKGLDLPNVDLIGIISSDNLLNFPDFRTKEKAFQTLTQVVGRTGRGPDNPGRVIIQTYNPENDILRHTIEQNYSSFYKQEINDRKDLNYPPFSRLIKISVSHKTNTNAKSVITNLYNAIKKYSDNIEILGPAPAFIPQVNNKFRWQLIIKHNNTAFVAKHIYPLINNNYNIDIDPYDLL